MTDIYSQITQHFDFLRGFGLDFNYIEYSGKLGDRNIQKFTYGNPPLQKKLDIVYCAATTYPTLYGYLIKYDQINIDPKDPKINIPFDRLRCFFDEGGDILFFGIEQYALPYKLKEFKLIIEKFISCVTSNDWVDYNELLTHERKIYTLTLEPKNYYTWADDIKSNDFIKNYTNITFDSSSEPSYEAYGLRLKSLNGIEFHITHGYKSRDEDGFLVQIIHRDNKSESHEFMNTGTTKVVEFIRQMVST